MAGASDITGVILAGGRGSRMGGVDKGLVEIAGEPMVRHVARVLAPQVGPLLLNANRSQLEYEARGFEVVEDRLADYAGPLAGMQAGLAAARTALVLFVPCDSPLLPEDLAPRMRQAMEDEDAAIVTVDDGERQHPVFALMRRDLHDSLSRFLEQGERKIDRWYAQHRTAVVHFANRPEAFLNVNRPEDRADIESRLGTGSPAARAARHTGG